MRFIDIVEDRITSKEVEYEEKKDRVIAILKGYKSQEFTKLGQKLERISALEEEMKQLKNEVKQATREDIALLFSAEDAIKTRVVDTISFMFTLSKDPGTSETVKYKEILTELEKHMTPELLAMLETLKKSMVTVVNREPSLRFTNKTIEEDASDPLHQLLVKFNSTVQSWANTYDQRLDQLQDQVA